MESVLRGEEISAVGRITYFPLRHHSPACAYHLRCLIKAIKPDCILIEGPQNAQEQIPTLAHADTKAPVALYYFYKDKKGLLSGEKESYKCYYPFLDCSPELVALRAAAALGVPARFIDLPYGEILLGTAEDKGIRRKAEKQTYNDDYLLGRNEYIRRLCEKSGLRSFDELWEKYFEIDGLYIDTDAFIERMSLWCGLSREHTPAEELEAEGCLLRERYMAQQIAAAAAEYARLLVVTGGFHTPGLQTLLKEEDGRIVYTGKPVKLHSLAKDAQGVYPLAYSMEAADALNGYASGMPSPGFYQRVWENLSAMEDTTVKTAAAEYTAAEHTETEHVAAEHTNGAYGDAVLHQLVRTGRQARRRKENVSSYDVICAFSMAKGLAALRGKREPGLYELKDAALSSFVKGECSLSTDLPLRILQELNTGKQVGSLCAEALRLPLLTDFEEQCKRFGLKVQASSQQEVTLQLFAKEKHLRMSRFFYRMEFLESGFAVRRKGADLVNRRDLSRVREVWTYRFSSQVLSALIDVSMSGGTVEEAAYGILNRRFALSAGTREAARLMAQGFRMGFLGEQARMGVHLRDVIVADGDYFSLAEGFSHLRMLEDLRELYQVPDSAEIAELTELCFQKIVQLLPSMAQVGEEQEKECMESCLSLYQISGRNGSKHYRTLLIDAFERLLGQKDINPGLEGAVLGLLYGCDGGWEKRIRQTAEGYLKGTDEMQKKSAAFLRGLFFTARDFVFGRDSFLEMIDELIGKLSPEAFMERLPELRMAFSYFTPLETDRLAQKAAALHGADAQELLRGRMVSPLEYEYGESLDAYAAERMQGEWTGQTADN